MIADYSQFLSVAEDGRIWWRKEDAIKLGAGYLPVCDNDRNLVPVLRAPNNRVRANERTLLGDFHKDVANIARPQVQERDGTNFVEAAEFLTWLSQYIAFTQATIPFPNDLARAVREAKAAADISPVKTEFEKLMVVLEGWFDKNRTDVPEKQRNRIDRDLFPRNWDELTIEQRKRAAEDWDDKNDPTKEAERERDWALWVEYDEVKREIAEWELVATPTALDKKTKDDRLRELRQRFANLEEQYKRMRGDYVGQRESSVAAINRDRTRSDAMSAEIEEAIRELGDNWTPYQVMQKLKTYAGKSSSCITEAGTDYVLWRNSSGEPSKLDLKNLRNRLYRLRKRTPNAKIPR
ncbi:MAG: hypothetical protein ACREV0_11115 [Burkholderiales bacterium]